MILHIKCKKKSVFHLFSLKHTSIPHIFLSIMVFYLLKDISFTNSLTGLAKLSISHKFPRLNRLFERFTHCRLILKWSILNNTSIEIKNLITQLNREMLTPLHVLICSESSSTHNLNISAPGRSSCARNRSRVHIYSLPSTRWKISSRYHNSSTQIKYFLRSTFLY